MTILKGVKPLQVNVIHCHTERFENRTVSKTFAIGLQKILFHRHKLPAHASAVVAAKLLE